MTPPNPILAGQVFTIFTRNLSTPRKRPTFDPAPLTYLLQHLLVQAIFMRTTRSAKCFGSRIQLQRDAQGPSGSLPPDQFRGSSKGTWPSLPCSYLNLQPIRLLYDTTRSELLFPLTVSFCSHLPSAELRDMIPSNRCF